MPAIYRSLPLQLTTWISSLALKLRCQTKMMCPSQVRVPAVPWDLHLLKFNPCRLQAKNTRLRLYRSINSSSTETTIHVFKQATSGYLLIERLNITFTSNGKREFVPRDQVSPLLVVDCLLFLLDWEQSLFSQSSLSSAGLERAKCR